MRRLGLSIYPEHSTPDKDLEYLKLGAKYGFSRLFTCLLSVEGDKERILDDFTKMTKSAQELGYEVSVDTNEKVFEQLGATPQDISVFKEMGVDIVRLDAPLSDSDNIHLINNPYGIKIEFNGSANNSLDLLIEKGANKENMLVCHNFYPQEFSGLTLERFNYFTDKYADLGLNIAAFVSSNNENTYGPWPVFKGLPTIEYHRGKDISYQLRHFVAMGKINDAFIGNAYASEEELKALSEVDLSKTSLKITLEEGVTDLEKEIVFNHTHFDRPDSAYGFVRSSVTRIKYNDTPIPARDAGRDTFKRGDVLIINDNLSHYRGELQIVRNEIPNTGDKNYIGSLSEEELVIFDLLKPEHLFRFI